MSQLKLGPLMEDRPVKMTIELPVNVHRDLLECAGVHATLTGQNTAAEKLIVPMLAQFMATNR